MSDSSSHFRISRIGMLFVLCLVPLLGPGTLVGVISIAAVLISYDGLTRQTVYGVTTALVVSEMIFGADVGVLSGAFLATVLLLQLTGRFVTVPAWALSSGWSVFDGVRALTVAWGTALCMIAIAVLIGATVYGNEHGAMRFTVSMLPRVLWIAATLSGGILILLRRLDVPFRRRISFGI
jgi:hypothetical protein